MIPEVGASAQNNVAAESQIPTNGIGWNGNASTQLEVEALDFFRINLRSQWQQQSHANEPGRNPGTLPTHDSDPSMPQHGGSPLWNDQAHPDGGALQAEGVGYPQLPHGVPVVERRHREYNSQFPCGLFHGKTRSDEHHYLHLADGE